MKHREILKNGKNISEPWDISVYKQPNIYVTEVSLRPPQWLRGKELPCQCRSCRRHKFDPWVRRYTGAGHGNPLQCSSLENPMDRGAWWATVHRVAKRRTRWKRLSVRTHTHTHQGPTWKLCSKPTIERNSFKAARGKDTLSTEE